MKKSTFYFLLLSLMVKAYGMEKQLERHWNFRLGSLPEGPQKEFFKAIEFHDFKKAQLAIANGANIDEEIPCTGKPLIWPACHIPMPELLRFLLINNSKVDLLNRQQIRFSFNIEMGKLFFNYALQEEKELLANETLEAFKSDLKNREHSHLTDPNLFRHIFNTRFFSQNVEETRFKVRFINECLNLALEHNDEPMAKLFLFSMAHSIKESECETLYDALSADFIVQLQIKTTNNAFKKLIALNPKKLHEFAKDPNRYKKLHPEEFNPVKRFPGAFKEEFEWCDNYKKGQLIEKYGSISKYVLKRELGDL